MVDAREEIARLGRIADRVEALVHEAECLRAFIREQAAEIAALRGELPKGWERCHGWEWSTVGSEFVIDKGDSFMWGFDDLAEGRATITRGAAPTLLSAIAACERARGGA